MQTDEYLCVYICAALISTLGTTGQYYISKKTKSYIVYIYMSINNSHSTKHNKIAYYNNMMKVCSR